MPKVELIFFNGCPEVDHARMAIRSAGVANFVEVNQDNLPKDSPYRTFSSPSILLNGKLVAGSLVTGGACSIEDWSAVTTRIKSLK